VAFTGRRNSPSDPHRAAAEERKKCQQGEKRTADTSSSGTTGVPEAADEWRISDNEAADDGDRIDG